MKTLIIKHKLTLLLLSSSFFICLIGFCSGLELGLSPPSINLSLDQKEVHCENFKIFSDKKIIVYMVDKWSKGKSKGIRDYVYSSEYFNISLEYNESLFVDDKVKSSYCISANSPGKYNGLFLVRDEDSRVGVGMWINLEVLGEEVSWITGNTIFGGEYDFNKLVFYEFIFLLIVFIVVFIVFWFKNRT